MTLASALRDLRSAAGDVHRHHDLLAACALAFRHGATPGQVNNITGHWPTFEAVPPPSDNLWRFLP